MDLSSVVWIPYAGVRVAEYVGTNFTEVGIGVRESLTMYDQGHSAATHIQPGEVDWKGIFLIATNAWRLKTAWKAATDFAAALLTPCLSAKAPRRRWIWYSARRAATIRPRRLQHDYFGRGETRHEGRLSAH